MRFQRHADAQPNIAIISIDTCKSAADAPVIIGPRLPLPDRLHDARHRRKHLDDLAVRIAFAGQTDDTDRKRFAALAIEKTGNAENAGNVFGARIRALALDHALHDTIKIGAAAFVGRPMIGH